jgi:hypothetical protein
MVVIIVAWVGTGKALHASQTKSISVSQSAYMIAGEETQPDDFGAPLCHRGSPRPSAPSSSFMQVLPTGSLVLLIADPSSSSCLERGKATVERIASLADGVFLPLQYAMPG